MLSFSTPHPQISPEPCWNHRTTADKTGNDYLSNPKHRHTHVPPHVSVSIPVWMFLIRWLLNAKAKCTEESLFFQTMWEHVVQKYIITHELWETLGKHMLAETCMQACIKHTHPHCSLFMQLFPFGIPWVVTLWHSLLSQLDNHLYGTVSNSRPQSWKVTTSAEASTCSQVIFSGLLLDDGDNMQVWHPRHLGNDLLQHSLHNWNTWHNCMGNTEQETIRQGYDHIDQHLSRLSEHIVEHVSTSVVPRQT